MIQVPVDTYLLRRVAALFSKVARRLLLGNWRVFPGKGEPD